MNSMLLGPIYKAVQILKMQNFVKNTYPIGTGKSMNPITGQYIHLILSLSFLKKYQKHKRVMS